MHVTSDQRIVQAEPGTSIGIPVDVVNTSAVIEGYTVVVHGLPSVEVSSFPERLSLFPGASGQIRVVVEVPTSLEAGGHSVNLEVVPDTDRAGARSIDVELSVSARPGVRLHRSPQRIRARRTARFLLQVENTGNTALDVELAATLENATTTASFSPRSVRVEPGATRASVLAVSAKRMVTGAEIDRAATIGLEARRTHSIAAMVEMEETEKAPDIVVESQVVLRQRPIISRGLLTVLILMSIIAVWAGIFAFGLLRAFGGDEAGMTPTVTYFAADPMPVAAGDAIAVPPKKGPLPPGVGGTVDGVVRARSTQLPLGRVLVEAFRDGADPKDPATFVSATATLDDGSYSLGGLLPGTYRLRMSSPGYLPVWYPSSAERATSAVVTVEPRLSTKVDDATVTGKPATITGKIDQSDDRDPSPTTITATATDSVADLSGDSQTSAQGVPTVRTSTTDGSYRLTGLLAPATYTVTFQTPGYDDRTATVFVPGGETRLQPTVIPGAEDGVVNGHVVDNQGEPVGGVTVITSVDGREVRLTTPTTGDVGAFSVGNLPIPGSYSLIFTRDGFGTTTKVVFLDAKRGQVSLPRVRLGADTGTVRGRLVGLDGAGLGGASVTVGGSTSAAGAAAPSTTTLTAGDVGAFTLTGLSAPASYTLTFTLEGFAPITVPVTLPERGPVDDVEVTLANELGSLGGRVVNGSRDPVSGAIVTITNGARSWTATTGSGTGSFRVDGLPPGSYSVTATADGLGQWTAFLRVLPGARTDQVLTLSSQGRD